CIGAWLLVIGAALLLAGMPLPWVLYVGLAPEKDVGPIQTLIGDVMSWSAGGASRALGILLLLSPTPMVCAIAASMLTGRLPRQPFPTCESVLGICALTCIVGVGASYLLYLVMAWHPGGVLDPRVSERAGFGLWPALDGYGCTFLGALVSAVGDVPSHRRLGR